MKVTFLPYPHAPNVRFADVRIDLHLREILSDEKEDRGLQTRCHSLANIDTPGNDNTIDRSTDGGVFEVQLCCLQRCSGLVDLGCSGQFLGRGQALLGTSRLELSSGGLQLRLGGLELRYRTIGGRLRSVQFILGNEGFTSHFLITLEDTTCIGESDFGFLDIRPGALGVGLRRFHCRLRIDRCRLRYLHRRQCIGHIGTRLGDLSRQECRVNLRNDRLPLLPVN